MPDGHTTSKQNTPHDKVYKRFFRDRRMVESLLREFVDAAVVQDLDFSSLEMLPTEHVSGKFHSSFNDVVWKINRQGNPCYVVLMLEFQSKADYWMALRVSAYTTELLLDLIHTNKMKAGEPLPLVIPIVLYNGMAKWKAAQDISDLFGELPDALKVFVPQHKHILLAVNDVSEEKLEQLHSLVPILFRLERSKSTAEWEPVLKRMIEIFGNDTDDPLVHDFINWLRLVLNNRYGKTKPLPEVQTLMELHTMLLENAARWGEEDYKRGELAGIRIGEARGKAIDRNSVIREILEDRFGTLPGSFVVRLTAITDIGKLRELTRAAYKVTTLQEFTDKVMSVQ